MTLYRWLKLPEFLGAYREARREVAEKAVAPVSAVELGGFDYPHPLACFWL